MSRYRHHVGTLGREPLEGDEGRRGSIASVKRETPAQNRGIHEYEGYSLSDEKTVMLLIRFRNQIYPYRADEWQFKELLSCLYMDLDALIEGAGLSPSEWDVVSRLMKGYSQQDIAELDGKSRQAVHTLLTRAAGKIAALQRARHEEWINERYHNAPFYLLEGDAHG